MHCPNCGQQQISEEMSFCSRCGFSLIAVKALIAGSSGGIERLEGKTDKPSRGQKSVRRATWLMLTSVVLSLIAGFLTAVDDDFGFLFLLPVILFIIAFVILLYGVFLADRKARSKGTASQVPGIPGQLGSSSVRSPELYLPPAQPMGTFTPHRVETAEMVQPRSVTENTTRLLDEESETRRR